VGTAAEFRGHIATTGTASTAAPAPASRQVDIPITSGGPLQSLRATTAEVAAGAATPPAPPGSTGAPENAKAGSVSSRIHPASWQAVSQADIDADLTFDYLPPDGGIITPIATAADQPDPSTAESVANLAHALPQWAPGSVSDPVQRVRNLLYVAAVPDLLQMDIERYVPAIVYQRIQEQAERSELIKVLCWIALHPFDDDDQAVGDVAALGLPSASGLNAEDVRSRAAVYGVKLLGRLLGRIDSK
jgi:hypothetical protein